MPLSPISSPSPGLNWLLELLASCVEPTDVHLRPGGDRRREHKVHLSTVDIALLGHLLDLLRDQVAAVSVSVEGNSRAETSRDIGRAIADAESDEETPLEAEILELLRREGKPLQGKVIANRLGRKDNGWLRACLSRLVKREAIESSRRGYRFIAERTTDESQCTDGG